MTDTSDMGNPRTRAPAIVFVVLPALFVLLSTRAETASGPLTPSEMNGEATSGAKDEASAGANGEASAGANGEASAEAMAEANDQASDKTGWGLAVFQAQRLVGVVRPSGDRVFLGSHPDTPLPLRDLQPLHASFLRTPEGIVVAPRDGLVMVGDQLVASSTLVDFGADKEIWVGQYLVVPIEAGRGPIEDEGSSPEVTLAEAGRRAASARISEFGKRAYRFCHDELFGSRGTFDHEYCSILDEDAISVCPAVGRSCPWARTDVVEGSDEDVPRALREFQIPELPRGLSLVIVIILVAVLVGGFIWTLVNAGWKSEEPRGLMDGEEISPAALDLQSLPETRASQLITLAERARSRGETREAALLLHLAALRYFDDEGLARFHPSKTNGDYHRAIRKHRELAAFFRAVSRVTERVRFGDGTVDLVALDENLGRAREAIGRAPPSAEPERVSGPVPGALAFLFAALVPAAGMSSMGCGEDDSRARPYHAHNPGGLSALPELLRSAGLKVIIDTPKLDEIDADVGVVVLRTSAASKTRGVPADLRLDVLLDRNQNVLVMDDHWLSASFLRAREVLPRHAGPGSAPTGGQCGTATAARAMGEGTRPRTVGTATAARAIGTATAVRLETMPADPRVYCTWNIDRLSRGLVDLDVRIPYGRRLIPEPGAHTATVSAHALVAAPIVGYAREGRVDRRGDANVNVNADANLDADAGVNADAGASAEENPDARAGAGIAASRIHDGKVLPGCLYVFSERDLFTNASLTRTDNARFVAALFAEMSGESKTVLFVDRLNDWFVSQGGPSPRPNPVTKLESSKLLPLLVQGLSTLVLFYLAIGVAFGPLRDRVRRTHKAFVEHVEAIGRQYARAGKPGLTHAAESVARLLVMRNRDRVRGGKGGGWEAFAEQLSEQHQLPGSEVRAALRMGIEGKSELGPSIPGDPEPSSPTMIETLSRLVSGSGNEHEPAGTRMKQRGRQRLRKR